MFPLFWASSGNPVCPMSLSLTSHYVPRVVGLRLAKETCSTVPICPNPHGKPDLYLVLPALTGQRQTGSINA